MNNKTIGYIIFFGVFLLFVGLLFRYLINEQKKRNKSPNEINKKLLDKCRLLKEIIYSDNPETIPDLE